MGLPLAIACSAGAVNIIGFVFYYIQIHKGDSLPNITSWGMWSIIHILNFLSYLFMTGDMVKSVLPGVSAVVNAAPLVWIYIKQKNRLQIRLSLLEITCLAIATTSMYFWWQTQSPTIANMFLQVSLTMGYIPTYSGVIKNRTREAPASWLLWSLSYILTAIVVILRWESHPQDLLYPISGMLANGGVGVIALSK